MWCNVVVLVRKKDGGLCFCIDFCCFNACKKKTSYPLPRIQKVLESLVGAGHFYCLDLKLGFWQTKMEEVSKQYTTFTLSNFGFFECDHMPFELCNAPATFQRLMQNCLSKLNLIYCLIYLDDIVIFLQTVEEHLHQLLVVCVSSHLSGSQPTADLFVLNEQPDCLAQLLQQVLLLFSS